MKALQQVMPRKSKTKKVVVKEEVVVKRKAPRAKKPHFPKKPANKPRGRSDHTSFRSQSLDPVAGARMAAMAQLTPWAAVENGFTPGVADSEVNNTVRIPSIMRMTVSSTVSSTPGYYYVDLMVRPDGNLPVVLGGTFGTYGNPGSTSTVSCPAFASMVALGFQRFRIVGCGMSVRCLSNPTSLNGDRWLGEGVQGIFDYVHSDATKIMSSFLGTNDKPGDVSYCYMSLENTAWTAVGVEVSPQNSIFFRHSGSAAQQFEVQVFHVFEFLPAGYTPIPVLPFVGERITLAVLMSNALSKYPRWSPARVCGSDDFQDSVNDAINSGKEFYNSGKELWGAAHRTWNAGVGLFDSIGAAFGGLFSAADGMSLRTACNIVSLNAMQLTKDSTVLSELCHYYTEEKTVDNLLTLARAVIAGTEKPATYVHVTQVESPKSTRAKSVGSSGIGRGKG